VRFSRCAATRKNKLKKAIYRAAISGWSWNSNFKYKGVMAAKKKQKASQQILIILTTVKEQDIYANEFQDTNSNCSTYYAMVVDLTQQTQHYSKYRN
jgi:hypothetical protein